MDNTDIAIIGMALRVPGASTPESFWHTVITGRQHINPVSTDDFLDAGGDPRLLSDPDLVLMASTVDGIEDFDADFFGCTHEEAANLDPQHRLFLECAYHAMERAGYVDWDGVAGLYGATNMSRYLLDHVNPRLAGLPYPASLDPLLSNLPDGFAARVAYELDLRGPALTVQSACASSLVAVHLACQDLLSHQCDLALAGGASIDPAAKRGYIAGGPLSPDGTCRVFDAEANGTLLGNGVGAVVLKRLDEALDDGDHIHAVIKGSAVANDGRRRLTRYGTGGAGIRSAAVTALAVAGVDPTEVGYLEPHASGTPEADEVELATLKTVFEGADVHLGSVKPHIGHLVQAAGIVGLIKTALTVEHARIPAVPHFRTPNGAIEGPFTVPAGLTEWTGPRFASVAASGSGGAHAHVVLAQAPPSPDTPREGRHLLQVSARTEQELEELTDDLTATNHALADVAHTLRTGRRDFRTRTFAVCEDDEIPEFMFPVKVVDNAAVALKFTGPDTERDIATARGLLATGITPALILGLGQGEYAAAAVAGAITDAEAVLLATQRDCPERYEKEIANSTPRAPKIPLLSGATGSLLSEQDITDCRHWLAIAEDVCPAIPELPRNAVTVDISKASGERGILIALGTLWAHGVELPELAPARRVPLPGYPFQRRRHWLPPMR